jgi:hypothetical protein
MNAASRLMKFDSIQKLCVVGGVVGAMSWAGVAPRTLGREVRKRAQIKTLAATKMRGKEGTSTYQRQPTP